MSYCKCIPIKTQYGQMCLECWPYCNICLPHPNPKYPGDTRHICKSCTDPSISILSNTQATKRSGLLLRDLDGVVGGYRGSKSYSTHQKYYSIKSIIDIGNTLFKSDPKKLKKLEKFKIQIQKDNENKQNTETKRKQVLDSVKLLGKFIIPIDFDEESVKNIIMKRFNETDINDNQITNLIICDLEDYSYYVLRKASLDNLISKMIPEKYHSYIKGTIYNDYLKKYYKNDDLLSSIFDELLKMYEMKHSKDIREDLILTHLKNKTNNNEELIKKLLSYDNSKEIFDDINIPIDTAYQKLDEIVNPIIEKYNQIVQLQKDMKDFNIEVTIKLNPYSHKLVAKKIIQSP